MDQFVKKAELEMDESFRKLLAIVALLKREIERLETQLDRRGTDALVNALGEVQQLGSRVDVACADFVARRQALHEAYALRKRMLGG